MMQCGGFDRLNRRAVIEALEMTRKRDLSRLTRFCPTRKRVFLPQCKSKQLAGAFFFPNAKAGKTRTHFCFPAQKRAKRGRIFLPQRKSEQNAGAFFFPSAKVSNAQTRNDHFSSLDGYGKQK